MGCYYTLCHNTYAYSLLFYKVYINRENAGSWDSGLEKEQILETYSTQLQKSWNFTEVIFRIYKKYWAQEVPEGGHTLATRVGSRPTPLGAPTSWAPSGPPMPILCYMESFDEEKMISKILGRDSATTRHNLGGTNLGLWAVLPRKLPSGRGKSSPTSSPTILSTEGVNLHQHLHQHHLISNPSSSLVSNLCIQTSD